MTELGSAERNLLAVLAEADEPTEADRERVRALVLQRVATATGIAAATYIAGSTAAGTGAATSAAAGSAAGAGAAPAALASSVTASSAVASSGGAAVVATTAAVTWKGAVVTKIAAALVGVGVASGAGWYAVKAQEPAPMSVQAPQAVSLAANPAAAPVAAPVAPAAAEPVVEAPKAAEPAVVHRAAPADLKANDHLGDEADLLKRAQRAINAGDTATALSLLQQHATTYPSGVLGQERIGLRAITLCRAGQHDQGVSEATRFLKGNPSSPLAERVKSSCELK